MMRFSSRYLIAAIAWGVITPSMSPNSWAAELQNSKPSVASGAVNQGCLASLARLERKAVNTSLESVCKAVVLNLNASCAQKSDMMLTSDLFGLRIPTWEPLEAVENVDLATETFLANTTEDNRNALYLSQRARIESLARGLKLDLAHASFNATELAKDLPEQQVVYRLVFAGPALESGDQVRMMFVDQKTSRGSEIFGPVMRDAPIRDIFASDKRWFITRLNRDEQLLTVERLFRGSLPFVRVGANKICDISFSNNLHGGK